MASIADIRHHMRVVSQTRQITKAMHMISTSKMKKGLARYEANAVYLSEVRQTIRDVLTHTEVRDHRYLNAPQGKRAAHIIIAADKGLAGGLRGEQHLLHRPDGARLPGAARDADRH